MGHLGKDIWQKTSEQKHPSLGSWANSEEGSGGHLRTLLVGTIWGDTFQARRPVGLRDGLWNLSAKSLRSLWGELRRHWHLGRHFAVFALFQQEAMVLFMFFE